MRERLRELPGVDTLLASPEAAAWLDAWPRPVVADAIRDVLAQVREQVLGGAPVPDRGALLEAIGRRLGRDRNRTLQPVINATGVVLHTNLGRAPLSPRAIDAVARVAGGYSNLEYDLDAGRRGSRHVYCEALLCRLTGAEAAFVVNNNAAAVLLVLSALCRGREVIISRGELVEIGGSFRIPEVMEQSGCVLREVGTTNRTHLHDYERAITDQTAAILKVHTSNYRMEGFVKSVPAAELAALCRERGLLLIEDLGSGVLLDTTAYGLGHEPSVSGALAAGCDLVTFSGDKLLGGPQAGLIAGRASLVEACRRHPLARALRVDKMTLAALQATLDHYVRGEPEAVPLWRMLAADVASLRRRAADVVAAVESLAARAGGLAGWGVSLAVEEVRATVGGGSLPGQTLPSAAVAVRLDEGRLEVLAERLRAGTPPVIGRIEEGRLLLDVRTVEPADDGRLARLLAAALADAAPQVRASALERSW